MSIMRYVGALAMSAALSAGCQGPEAQDTDQVAQGIKIWTTPNSSLAIGGMMNGVPIRGLNLRGSDNYVMSATSDTASRIRGMIFHGRPVTSLTAVNGVLQATTAAGTATAFTAGDPLTLQIADSLKGTLRIYVAQTTPSYTAYTAEYSTDGQNWQAFCPHNYVYTTQGGDLETFVAESMIPVGGAKWDSSNGNRVADNAAITLACAHDAVGGCVTWGYAPWSTGNAYGQTMTLEGYHQTCTRLKRADFCGNGTSHTSLNAGVKKHVTIQVWDSIHLNDSGDQSLASMEGFWNPNGATCLNADQFRTSDTTNSQFGMLEIAMRDCPKPACSSLGPTTPTFVLGSGKPIQ